jgi:hypothetical protein
MPPRAAWSLGCLEDGERPAPAPYQVDADGNAAKAGADYRDLNRG